MIYLSPICPQIKISDVLLPNHDRVYLHLIFAIFLVMEHQWNDIDRGKPKYSGKNLSQCHFVHHKSHMD
jgi:hypothetical protein